MTINRFDLSVKSEQGAYKKLVEMTRNDDYTSGNLLDYLYHQNYYKFIGIDLSRQTNTTIPQQTNFTWKIEEENCAKNVFYCCLVCFLLKSSKK